MRAVSVQNCSSPKVSNRKTRWPAARLPGERSSVAGAAPVGVAGAEPFEAGGVAHAENANAKQATRARLGARSIRAPGRVAIQPPFYLVAALMSRLAECDCQVRTAFSLDWTTRALCGHLRWCGQPGGANLLAEIQN